MNKLLAAQLRGRMAQQELVALLLPTGATHQEIGDILGTSADTVEATKRYLKKHPLSKKKGRTTDGKEK